MIHDPEVLAPLPSVVFELQVACSAPVWPEACSGIKPVMQAVQKLLEAAANGKSIAFDLAEDELTDAVFDWRHELFGVDNSKRDTENF